MRRIAVLTACLAVGIVPWIAVTFLGSDETVKPLDGSKPSMHATWVGGGKDSAGMTKDSKVVVVARVTAIEAGQPLTTPKAPDVKPIPTQKITLEVERALKGKGLGKKSTITVNKTGDQVFWIEGDPPYNVGEKYLFFLTAGADGAYIPYGPDGRVKVVNDRLSTAADQDLPIAKEIKQESLNQLDELTENVEQEVAK